MSGDRAAAVSALSLLIALAAGAALTVIADEPPPRVVSESTVGKMGDATITVVAGDPAAGQQLCRDEVRQHLTAGYRSATCEVVEP